ncbi:hypothetical protein BJV82DRAFT_58810 [Fennellomyces sp. T-0311]|nr:hypothetical protein BJV82DRAFT_58810 [Fennellomyces sp. T-0311]
MADKTSIKRTGKKPSSRLLGMKFMQRSLEKEQQEELEKERKRIITESEWVLEYETDEVQKSNIQVDYQPSYLAFTQPASSGRQSFKEFNKVTEEAEAEAARRKEDEKQEARDRRAELDEQETLNMMRDRLQQQGKKRNRPSSKQNGNAGSSKKSKPSHQKQPAERGFIKPE